MPLQLFQSWGHNNANSISNSIIFFAFVFVILSCLFLVALRSPAGKGLTSWLSFVLCFLVFYHVPICVLIHTKTKGEVGTV